MSRYRLLLQQELLSADEWTELYNLHEKKLETLVEKIDPDHPTPWDLIEAVDKQFVNKLLEHIDTKYPNLPKPQIF